MRCSWFLLDVVGPFGTRAWTHIAALRHRVPQGCALAALSFALTTLGVGSSNVAMAEEIDSLADLRWEHRIILGSTPEEQPALDALSARALELRDRDLLYFLLSGSRPFTNASRSLSAGFWEEVAHLVPSDGFVLIGRDGGVKARYEELDLDAVFALIDTMPMRIQELRNRVSQ